MENVTFEYLLLTFIWFLVVFFPLAYANWRKSHSANFHSGLALILLSVCSVLWIEVWLGYSDGATDAIKNMFLVGGAAVGASLMANGLVGAGQPNVVERRVGIHEVENPIRLRRFQGEAADLDWSPANLVSSVRSLKRAVEEIAIAEISYYYRERKRRKRFSTVLLSASWFLLTIAALTPLLAQLTDSSQDGGALEELPLLITGYILAAFGGSLLILDRVIGATSGYRRFAETQLALEARLIIFGFRVERLVSQLNCDSRRSDLLSVFDEFEKFAEEIGSLVRGETGRWSAELEKAIAELARSSRTGRSGNG